MTDNENVEENDELVDDWSSRKEVEFIKLRDITHEERDVKTSFKRDAKFENIENIQFKCQPKTKDSNLTSMSDIDVKYPVKEIVYRILVNHKRPLKLEDIIEKTYGIMKNRRPAFSTIEQDVYVEFFNLLTKDNYYGFEEVL